MLEVYTPEEKTYLELLDKVVKFNHFWMTFINDSYSIFAAIESVIDICSFYKLDMEECMDIAYKEISGRTGKMINGTFVKDKK